MTSASRTLICVGALLLLGGAGFVGRAVAEEYLRNGWCVVITTRSKEIEDAKDKLISHGFNKHDLEKLIKNKRLLFALNVDLIDKKWSQVNNWLELLRNLDVPFLSILRIINLVGETSKSADEILKSNVEVLDNIFVLIKYLKCQNKELIFCNIGSTAEKRMGDNLPPYEKAKKIARQKIEKSNLCDYHFVVNYIKGRGEKKMKLAAPYLWNKLKFSHKWFFGFQVSIIDVDDLAKVFYSIPGMIKDFHFKQKPIEINVTNGELLFGEMMKNLLPENKRVMPRLIIPAWFEDYFLRSYSFMAPRIRPDDQFVRRLATFAMMALNQSKQQKLKVFKTAEEIKKLTSDVANYSILKASPDLIVADEHHSVIYVLIEKNKGELIKIVQKAIDFSV